MQIFRIFFLNYLSKRGMSKGAFTRWNQDWLNPLKSHGANSLHKWFHIDWTWKIESGWAFWGAFAPNNLLKLSHHPCCFENAGGKSALGWVANLETTGYPPHPPFFEASAVENKWKPKLRNTKQQLSTLRNLTAQVGVVVCRFQFGFV